MFPRAMSEAPPDVFSEQYAGEPFLFRSLNETELVEELTVAAMARGRRRIDRLRQLLAERDRRLAAELQLGNGRAGKDNAEP
jgi:hypothetical protein